MTEAMETKAVEETKEVKQEAASKPKAVTEQSKQKDITDVVLMRVNELQAANTITLPSTYNAGNALKSAWLTLQKVTDKNKNPALQVCTQNSVANALFDMCVQGLTPAKNQCYFVVRGKELTLMRSYFGTAAVLKRLKGVSDVYAQVIYQGDKFEYAIENGNLVVTCHEQKLENIDLDKIVGAYAVIIKDGQPRAEIMTMKQIRQAWSHTTTGGAVQKEYPDQMAKRTVINRAAKMYINTSDDADELIEAINNSTESEYTPEENGQEIDIRKPAEKEAIATTYDIKDAEVEQQPQEEKPAKKQARNPGF